VIFYFLLQEITGITIFMLRGREENCDINIPILVLISLVRDGLSVGIDLWISLIA
jgi:hypothetical protein